MKKNSTSQETANMPGEPVKQGSDLLKQLQESQDRLRIALECANIGVFDWDVANKRVIYIHPMATSASGELLEYQVDESHWFETSNPDDIPLASDRVSRAVRGETDAFSMRYRMQRSGCPEGEWSVVHSRGRVRERDTTGRASRILGVYEDITAIVAREEHDRQRDTHLARTIRLASLGELASSLAHEINQPLATLTTYLQAGVRAVSMDAMTKEELLEILRRSERQANLVAEIVKRLRTLYRNGLAAEETFDLIECVNAVIMVLRREIEAHHILVQVSSRFKRGLMTGDRLQIEQVLYNIIRNAVDALQHQEEANGEIRVSIRRNANRYLVTISDNGPGIPEEARRQLFEPFFTTKPNGTGLGLSISRTIVEAHRGRIDFDTTSKQGTRFIIDLPAPTKR